MLRKVWTWVLCLALITALVPQTAVTRAAESGIPENPGMPFLTLADPEIPVDPENPEDPENPTDPENPEDPENPTDPENPENPVFTDVPRDRWYYDSVMAAYEAGIMKGIEEDLFVPGGELTRGMFVTILGRIAQIDPEDYPGTLFVDVKEESWYTPYVNWAARNGIVNGVGDLKFAPGKSITREQMATILDRYVMSKGMPLPQTEVDTFNNGNNDMGAISSWASRAVNRIMEYGIMEGVSPGYFSPKATTTRAQAAAVFVRLVEVYENVDLTGYVRVTGYVMEFGYDTRLPGAQVNVSQNGHDFTGLSDENGDFCIYALPSEDEYYANVSLSGYNTGGVYVWSVTEDTDVGYVALEPDNDTLRLHFFEMLYSGEAATLADNGEFLEVSGYTNVNYTHKGAWSDRFEAYAIIKHGPYDTFIVAGKTFADPNSPWYNFAFFTYNNQSGRVEHAGNITSTFLAFSHWTGFAYNPETIPDDNSGVYCYIVVDYNESHKLTLTFRNSISYQYYGGYYYYTMHNPDGSSSEVYESDYTSYVASLEDIPFYYLPDLS